MDNLRGLLGIRRIDKILNAWIKELCRVTKGVDKRIDKGVLWCFSHMERMENDRIAKRVYVGECASSCSVGRLWKKRIDTMKDCLNNRGLNVRQARRMVHDRSEWHGFVTGNVWGIAWGMKLWLWQDATVVGCHSYMNALKGRILPMGEPTT